MKVRTSFFTFSELWLCAKTRSPCPSNIHVKTMILGQECADVMLYTLDMSAQMVTLSIEGVIAYHFELCLFGKRPLQGHFLWAAFAYHVAEEIGHLICPSKQPNWVDRGQCK